MVELSVEEAAALLGSLTAKQRAVLDLLIQHKTSKEIGIDLGISPHTVEQRIRFAKQKLGMERRSDLATTYRDLLTICDEIVYEELSVASSSQTVQDKGAPDGQAAPGVQDHTVPEKHEEGGPVSLVPAIFEGPVGIWMRIGAVFAIAVAIIILVLGGLSLLEQLSRMMV